MSFEITICDRKPFEVAICDLKRPRAPCTKPQFPAPSWHIRPEAVRPLQYPEPWPSPRGFFRGIGVGGPTLRGAA